LFFGEAFVEFTNNVAPSKLGGEVSSTPNERIGSTLTIPFGRTHD
jgi:hypothetical protein